MAVFNARNERFLLSCMVAVSMIFSLYYVAVSLIYYNGIDVSADSWRRVDNKSELFGYTMLLLSCYYFYSCGSGRRATFDFPFFYFFALPFNLFYCSFRYKGFVKGLGLALFWITAYSVPIWADYLVYTWTYWNYESP